jgi:deoxycytidine triphosphate deaminase
MIDRSAFASTVADAEARFEQWRSLDPFPEIAPSLLNTADLLDYVAKTGMVHPFPWDDGALDVTLKPASCGIAVRGRYLYWRDEPETEPVEVTGRLDRDNPLRLERNSIIYVTLDPVFRFPDYIAGRFNLTIRDVYRGLLVGTGPLVDPGFIGRLSVPLHNLTSNEYVITGGEPLVWMEFTKLSPNTRWLPDARIPVAGEYVPFPKRKLERATDVRSYVERAGNGRPIRSSIPEALIHTREAAADASRSASRSQQDAADARRATEDLVEHTRRRQFWAGIALGVTLLLGLVSIWNLIHDVNGDIDRSDDKIAQLQKQLDVQEARLDKLLNK